MFGTSLDTILQILKWVVNTVFHQCNAVIFIYGIWIAIEQYSNPFSWHVILCTLGIFPFMIEALILFSNINVWSQEIERKQKFWIHSVLIFLGTFFIITGIALEIDRKVQTSESHFTSAHAITGLVALIFLIFALILGPFAFSSLVYADRVRPVWFKLAHNILGQIAYILIVTSFCLGFHTDWFSFYTTSLSRNVATIVTVILMVFSLVCAWKSTFNQIKSISN